MVFRNNSFQKRYSLQQRQERCRQVRLKFPTRIPVIIEKQPGSNVPSIDKNQYLVPSDLTMGQFAYVIRKRLTLAPEQAIFLFSQNNLPPTSAIMASVYEKFKDKDDGFLYMVYAGENTFG